MTAKQKRQNKRRKLAASKSSERDQRHEAKPSGEAGPGGPAGRGQGHAPKKRPHRGAKRRYHQAIKAYQKAKRHELKRREKDPYKKATPGKAGKKAPFVKPFMTAEDLMQYGEAHAKFADTLNQLDFQLENTRIAGEYEKTNLEKGRIRSTADANDDYARRGLFQSSIRDADLYDINATTGLKKAFLDDQLSTMQIQNETQKVAAQNAWDDFQRGMNQKQVQNAQEVMTNTGKWLVDPVKARAATGYKPKPIGPRPNRKDFKPRPRHPQPSGPLNRPRRYPDVHGRNRDRAGTGGTPFRPGAGH